MVAYILLAVIAVVLDYFFGKNAFTSWFGWYLFLSVVICMPAHMYSYILQLTLGSEEFAKKYPNPEEYLASHKTFLFAIFYSLFL